MKIKKLLFLVVTCFSFSGTLVAQYNLNWAASIGGNDSDDVRGMDITSVGEIIITGNYRGTSDFDPSSGTTNLTSVGDQDIFVSKLDSNGVLQWAISMGGSLSDQAIDVAVGPNDDIYITGYFMGTCDFDPGIGNTSLIAAGDRDIFVAKYNTSGALVWAKQLSGTDSEQGEAITVTSTGVYTTGRAMGTVDFDPGVGTNNVTVVGGNDIFISKLDFSGNFVWVNVYGSNGGSYGIAMTSDVNGNIYTTGNFKNTIDFDLGAAVVNLTAAGNKDVFILKIDSLGDLVWAKSVGGSGDDIGHGIEVDVNQNVYVTGFFEGTGDFDPGTGVSNLTSSGGRDIFVQKLDAAGNYVWAHRMGSSAGDDQGKAISVDNQGNVYSSGFFEGTVDFDPSAATSNLTSLGLTDMYLQKLDATGAFLYASQIGSTLEEGNNEILVNNNSIYMAGRYSGIADADPNTSVSNITSAGLFDGYVVKWSDFAVSISENETVSEFTIYPNPASEVLMINGKNINDVKVFNSLGQEMTSVVISNKINNTTINVANLTSGIYMVKVNNNTYKFYKK